jgi:hypothetical protein
MLTQVAGPLGTGWFFQPVPNHVLFQLLITVYACSIAMHTRAIHYYMFISRVQVKIMYDNN